MSKEFHDQSGVSIHSMIIFPSKHTPILNLKHHIEPLYTLLFRHIGLSCGVVDKKTSSSSKSTTMPNRSSIVST